MKKKTDAINPYKTSPNIAAQKIENADQLSNQIVQTV